MLDKFSHVISLRPDFHGSLLQIIFSFDLLDFSRVTACRVLRGEVNSLERVRYQRREVVEAQVDRQREAAFGYRDGIVSPALSQTGGCDCQRA